jgi:hypothetical protein
VKEFWDYAGGFAMGGLIALALLVAVILLSGCAYHGVTTRVELDPQTGVASEQTTEFVIILDLAPEAGALPQPRRQAVSY